MEILLNFLSAILALTIVLITIPPVLRVAKAKKLFDHPGDRKIHKRTVPALGGVAIFLGFIISSLIFTDGYPFHALKHLVAALILLFFIGLKDDLLAISPRKKFIVQLFAVILLVTLGGIRFSNLHGILGIYEIPSFAGILLSVFAILTIINAFNLIDGIDGLAAGCGILASFIFGLWFFQAGEIPHAIVSFALTGSLAGFFYYNVFGRENKLFMGDTGSLIIGLIIAALVIQFNELNVANNRAYAIKASPVVSFAIISFPLIDMLRVMTIRISSGHSPFRADRNHIHHRLLELLPDHLGVTLVILTANAFLIGLAFVFNTLYFNINAQFLLILLLSIVFSFVPSRILQKKMARKKSQAALSQNEANRQNEKEKWVAKKAAS